jgi:hypothetical protein
MADKQKTSIFQKVVDTAGAFLDAQLIKARESTKAQNEADFVIGKSITRDRNHYYGSQGYQERPGAIGYEFQKRMAVKSAIIAAIVRTRQNEAAAYSRLAVTDDQKGFRIVLKDENKALEAIKKELFGDDEDKKEESRENSKDVENQLSDASEEIKKAEELDSETHDFLNDVETPLNERDKDREAKKELDKRISKKMQAIGTFIEHCGELKNRPFETKKWNFDAFIRAVVYDSLVYDQACMELVPKNAENLNGKFNLHHFYPMDSSTIRFASPELRKYKDSEINLSQDILYPEAELEALEERDALELDDERLEKDEYKFVQVVKGRIQRAFTEDELAMGIRNPITDIYTNGYSLSELEVLVGLVSSHLQTEHYNKSYFQQGFSAKGILHIKANLNRSKLEELKRHWTHMVKGNRNSFQTPIMSGMEEIQWIPLTQNHSEMEFSLWLNYLIKMICAVYQIDPSEIGYGMKDEGGAGMSGDNTVEKLEKSKSKGFIPLMRFLASYINVHVIDKLDPDYCLEWVGLEDEDSQAKTERQAQEVKFKKSVNDIREESGLPPIEGADDLILDPVYFQWYSQFHPEGQKLQQQQMAQEQDQTEQQNMWDAQMQGMGDQNAEQPQDGEPVEKSLKIEYYKINGKD